MSINIKARTDCSFLFSNLNAAGNSTFLSDYASIKNGSYYKLMKAYYAKDGASDSVKKIADSKKDSSVSKDDSKTLATMKKATDNLKESADELMTTGSKSLFNKKDITKKDELGNEYTEKDYDTAAIYKAVSGFVNDYNSVLQAADKVNSTSVTGRVKTMVSATTSNEKMLSKVGITVNTDKTLSIDKDAFMKADMNTVKSIFNGTGSYAYRVSAQASMINFAADKEASKANTYNFNGKYANNYSSGNIFNSIL